MRDEDRSVLSKHKGSAPGKAYIGFWRSEYEPDLPDPRDFVDESWEPVEREAVASYLDDGEQLAVYRGSSDCRICGKMNGGADLGDGTYVWPSGFSHYVRDHSVRPPAEFVKYVMARSGQ